MFNCSFNYVLLFKLIVFLIALPARVSANAIDYVGEPWEVCAMCHGLDGVSFSPKFPILAGQKESYLIRQINAFRSGHRTNDGGQMVNIATEINIEQIDSVAKYFSSLPPPTPNNDALKTYDTETLSSGKNIYSKQCANCHNNPKSEAPWIDLQHSAYLLKQLTDFIEEKRIDLTRGDHAFLKNITNSELVALAEWLSNTKLRQ